MKRAFLPLLVATLTLSACNPIDVLFPKDERLGDEEEYLCVGRVRATLTYQDYQELENAPGRFVPSYIYDITNLDLAGIQALIASGADDTAGTRLIQQTANTSAAVERFKLTKVDRKGALFLGREPALYKVAGRPQPASTILASGCKAQKTNTRLIEVSWVPVKAAPAPEPASEELTDPNAAPPPQEPPPQEPQGDVIELDGLSNTGGVQ